jgi:hypothetical protein
MERYSDKLSKYRGNVEMSVDILAERNNKAGASKVYIATAPVVIRAEEVDVDEAK